LGLGLGQGLELGLQLSIGFKVRAWVRLALGRVDCKRVILKDNGTLQVVKSANEANFQVTCRLTRWDIRRDTSTCNKRCPGCHSNDLSSVFHVFCDKRWDSNLQLMSNAGTLQHDRKYACLITRRQLA